MNRIRNFIKSEEAIAVTEYGLLVALVAGLLIGVVTIFGSSRSAVLSVILFFVLGALVLTRVDVAAGEAQAAGPR